MELVLSLNRDHPTNMEMEHVVFSVSPHHPLDPTTSRRTRSPPNGIPSLTPNQISADVVLFILSFVIIKKNLN